VFLSTDSPLRKRVAALGIRASFLLGITAMAVFMILVTAIALLTSTLMTRGVGDILDNRLPSTLASVNAEKAVDTLAAAGSLLVSVRSSQARETAFARVARAQSDLQLALDDLVVTQGADSAAEVIRLSHALNLNLENLRALADQRLSLIDEQIAARGRLLSILQAFQQNLTHRIRILEGDSDVIRLLGSRSEPPTQQIAALATDTAPLIPLASFYADIESVGGRLLAAGQDPNATTLALSEQVVEATLSNARETLQKLSSDLASALQSRFLEMQELSTGSEGIIELRRSELTLLETGENWNQDNQRIINQVNAEVDSLVNQELAEIDNAGETVAWTGQIFLILLLGITITGLLGLAAFFYFHVIRHLIDRISTLSNAMQMIAAGHYDVALPPEGNDELGRLGRAVHTFRDVGQSTAIREQQLQILNAELEKLSISDALTGLANRRCFDDVLNDEWERAMRSQQPLAVLMLDVDNFKRYNDRYGHLAGDQCLKHIATVLKDRVYRSTDLAARYGGEEFVVILENCVADDAVNIAQQIRIAVANLKITHDAAIEQVVTVSIGAAAMVPSYTEDLTQEKPSDTLLRMADNALYRAKVAGRNRVELGT